MRLGLVREEAVVGQVGSVKGRRKSKRKGERSPQEAVGVLWLVIDEAKSSLYDPLASWGAGSRVSWF